MKIKLIVVLCLALSLLLCACGGANESLENLQVNVGETLENMTEDVSVPEETQTEPQQTEEETEPEQTEDTPVTPTEPKPTESPVTEPEPTEPPKVEVKNEFFNDSNNFYEAGQVNVRPRHMYWDGNVLVAQCFVINGLDTPVTNINVTDLDFSNGSGLIADAQFGILQGVTLQPHTHVLWTFKFGSDVVYQPGGDLSSIDYHSRVSFDH
jgi:SLAP domain-containing protein